MRRRVNKRSFIIEAGAVAVALVMAACSSGSGSSSGNAGSTTSIDQPNAAAGAGSGGSTKCSKTDTVTFASVGSTTDAGLVLANKLGYFKRYCITYKYKRITTAPAETAALASNAVQVAGISEAPGLFTGVSQGIDMRIVGDKQSCTTSTCSDGLVVRKSLVGPTTAQTMANLKGKKFAIASKGDATLYITQLFMHKYDMTPEDMKLVLEPFPDMAGAIEHNQVQAAFGLEPFATQMVESGCCKWYSYSAISQIATATQPPTQVAMVYGPEFLKSSNKSLATRFMEAYVLGVRAYNDAFLKGKNKASVEKIIAESPQVNLPVSTVQKIDKAYLDPNQLAVGQSGARTATFLSDLQDYYVSKGLLRKDQTVPASKMLDLSFSKAAVKALGVYQ